MSVHLILRLCVMLVGAALGYEVGAILTAHAPASLPLNPVYSRMVLGMLGAVLGYIVGPDVTIRPYRVLRSLLGALPVRSLVMGGAGLLIGLLFGALLAFPLSMLPGIVGSVTPIIAALLLAALGATTMALRDQEILSFLGLYVGGNSIRRQRNIVLLDTSAIIDGRIADIVKTGFITGTIVVPRFILEELQHIADSPESVRRNRGRRGLDVLDRLQKDGDGRLEISDMDVREVSEVDGKLVALAQRLDCPIVTNDYNLNRVAGLQGVRVLNINELANAVKIVLLPGEIVEVHIIQEGKEPGQGVAYLDDGTMVVVEDGRKLMGQSVEILVTRVLQTVAGRMVFGYPRDSRR